MFRRQVDRCRQFQFAKLKRGREVQEVFYALGAMNCIDAFEKGFIKLHNSYMELKEKIKEEETNV